jgi:RHS repeat-associated protein
VLCNRAEFTYDGLGRLTQWKSWYETAGLTKTYTHDYLGNLTNKEGIAQDYDVAQRPHTLLKIAGSTYGISHDLDGNRTGKPNWTYEYDQDDRLRKIKNNGVEKLEILYDYAGRQVIRSMTGTTGLTRYYGDLAEAAEDGYLTKHYFAGGMRIASQRVYAPQFAALPGDPAIQLAGLPGGHWGLVLLLNQKAQIGMAATATLLATGLLLAPWPACRSLGAGRRRKRVVGIAIRQGHVIGIVVLFTIGTLPVPILLRPAEAQSMPTLYHYHLDHLGSTHAVTDTNGNVVEYIRYKPYGEVRGRYNSSGGSISTQYRYEFTTYETEITGSGLQYAGARWYDPALGMFLTHDPARQFASPYSYGGGDPLNWSDPTGEDFGISALIAAFVIGFAIGFTATAIQAGVNGASFPEALRAGAISGAIGGALAAAGLGVLQLAAHLGGPYAAYGLAAAMTGGGAYSTAESFRSGQYVLGSVGVTFLALGVYGLAQGPDTLYARLTQGAAQGASVGGSSPGSGTAGGSNLDPRPLTPDEQVYLENLHGRSFAGVSVDEGFVGERWAAGQVRSDAQINVEGGFSQYSRTDQLGLLGHEGTHIVQRQLGILDNFKGFFSHAAASITGTDLYAIPNNYSGSFWNLNFEQQAVIVENVGRFQLGQSPLLFPSGRNLSVPRTLGLYMEYRGVR